MRFGWTAASCSGVRGSSGSTGSRRSTWRSRSSRGCSAWPSWKQVVGNHGFTLSESSHGLRTKHGLFDVQRQTIPPGRVQGLLITEPLIWRLLGWSRVELDIAGVVHQKEDGDHEHEGAQLL